MNTHSVDTTAHIAAEVKPHQDLVAMVTEALTTAGHQRPSDWQRRLHADAINLDLPDDQRRFLVNRALRMVLADAVGENTMDIRYCLVDQGEIVDWFRLVQAEVVPCIVRHNLPPALN